MASSSVFKPGILQGLYPEKNSQPSGFLDQSLLWAENHVNRKFKHNQKSLENVAVAINKCT